MDKLAELIAGAAERLGIEAVRVWPQIVMVTWIRSLVYLAMIVALYVATYVICRRVAAWITRPRSDGEYVFGDDETGFMQFLGEFVGGAVLAIGLMIATRSLPDVMAGVFAPEAMTVLRMVGK